MQLPNGDRVVVDVSKLRDYCLNPNHEDCKHKARVFASALVLTRADAESLRQRLLAAAANATAELVSDPFSGLCLSSKRS